MTLVYAKIIGIFVCGADPGGRGGGTRGYLKLFTRDCSTHIAVGRDGGCGSGAMMGVARGQGRGWGQALIEVFEQNRYRYIEFGYRHAHYETKSAEIAGNP